MTSKPTDTPQQTIGVEIANQIIDLANTHLEQGASTSDIASGLRHAAANFTAYEFFQSDEPSKDPNTPVEEFISFFENYLSIHKPKEAPAQGLMQLVEQAKNEVSK